MVLKNADSGAHIGSLGGLALGALGAPGAGTNLQITGSNTSSGTYPIVVKNSAATNIFLLANDGSWQSSANKFAVSSTGALQITGADTSGGTFPFVLKNSAATNLFLVANDGSWQSSASAFSVDSAGAVNTTSVYKKSSTQVVGARATGWTAFSGTGANIATAYDTATITLVQLAERVRSIQAALTTHGLIGA